MTQSESLDQTSLVKAVNMIYTFGAGVGGTLQNTGFKNKDDQRTFL